MELRLVGTNSDAAGGEAVDPLAALAAAAARGDARATQTLLLSVSPAMLRAVRGVIGARSLEVRDVLQESVWGLSQALASFRRECTVLHFACRIAVRTALAARRRRGTQSRNRDEPPADDVEDQSADETRSPEELVMAARRREILRALCDELPPPQSEALIMHAALGYTVEEVADATVVPANTVRSRLRLAKEALRARIAADPGLREALERAW